MALTHIVSVNLLSDLRLQKGNTNNIIITLGNMVIGDGGGALYYWDNTDSSSIEDNVYFNTIKVTNWEQGRWKKVFTRMLTLPHGTLFISNGKKEFFYTGTTDNNGERLVYLTIDNTPNGPAIFSKVLFNSGNAIISASSANDVVVSGVKSLSVDLKSTVHKFVRGTGTPLTTSIVLGGLTVNAFSNAVVGTAIQIKVEGI